MIPMPWTQARIERLTTLWKANELSAAGIAADLGGISRNAVIGKANRLGLTGRTRRPSCGQPARTRTAPVASGPRPRRSTGVAAALAALPDTAKPEWMPACKRVSLFELDGSNCHWPIGTVGDPDFAFCGNSSLSGFSYCAHHMRLARAPSRADDPKVGIVPPNNR